MTESRPDKLQESCMTNQIAALLTNVYEQISLKWCLFFGIFKLTLRTGAKNLCNRYDDGVVMR